MKPATPSKSAFTLVELLVVIAIIGILVALLLPVLSKAKDRARRVACLSNVRNLNTMFISYARDNNDRLPRFVSGNGGPNGIWPALADHMNLYKLKADSFFDPGMRPWRSYDRVLQTYYYSFLTNRGNGAPQPPVVNIGYVPAFYLQPGMENQCPDFNVTIVPQPVQLGVILLAPTNSSERVLTAGMITGGTNFFYNGFLGDVVGPIIFGGPLDPANLGPVNHRNGSNPREPAGENLGMLDGSAKWRNFKEMRQRKYKFILPDGSNGGGNTFWW